MSNETNIPNAALPWSQLLAFVVLFFIASALGSWILSPMDGWGGVSGWSAAWVLVVWNTSAVVFVWAFLRWAWWKRQWKGQLSSE